MSRTRRRFLSVLGLAALVVGVAVVAAVAIAVSHGVPRCNGGGEARTGDVALRLDAPAVSARR